MRSCSASVGSSPAFARSSPMAVTMMGVSGARVWTFTAFGVRSRLSRNCGKVSQSQGIPSFIVSKGIASTRVMDCMARSRAPSATGAKPNPQLPRTTDVTPCQPDIVQWGSQKIWAS